MVCILLRDLFTTLRGQNQNRQHEITFEDYFNQVYIECCTASPDGKHIAYIESCWDKNLNGRSYDLWTVNMQTKKVQRLTFDSAKKEYPQWDSVGKRVFFKSRASNEIDERSVNNESSQVWQVGIDGTGLMPLTHGPNGIQRYKFISDAAAIYFTVTKLLHHIVGLKTQPGLMMEKRLHFQSHLMATLRKFSPPVG